MSEHTGPISADGQSASEPRSVRLTSESLAVVVSVSVVLGLAAALVGGPLTELGSGFGGLYGLPAMMSLLIAVGIAIPAAVVTARRAGRLHRRVGAAVVIAGGAWVVAIGYSSVAHAVDPCLNGWWDASSHIGDQPLCERFGPELNWHSRFHLLAHAVPAAVLLAGYLWSVERWARPGVDAHAPSRTDPSAVPGQVGVGSDPPR